MKIFLINSKEESICPCCGSPLKYRDSRRRVHKIAGGDKEWYLIRRLKCTGDKCGRLHNELPDCICPYKHYDAGLIEDVADGVVSEEDTLTTGCSIRRAILEKPVQSWGYVSSINYRIWTSSGGTPGNGTSPAFPDGSLSACLKALTVFPYSLYGIALCIGIFGLLVFMVMRMDFGRRGTYDKERNLTYSDQGTYGTSGFMTDAEMREVLELVPDIAGNRGVILGKLYGKAVCLPEKTRMNRNVAVFGASGSMKSRAYARNVVFQCVKRGESLIITDPKSELYANLCLYLEENGYTVRVFNLINPENSDSWNCLAEIEEQEIMAQLFSDVIIKNTGSPKGDHFWDNSEMNLLKALVLYVDQGFPPEGKNIGQVYKLLTMNSEKELNSLFDLLPVTHPAKAPYNIFRQASDTVRSGVIIGLGTRLQVFQNKLIRQITSCNEISLTQPGYEKCAYFCITSDQDST